MHGRHSLGFTPCADSLGDIITVYACFYYYYFIVLCQVSVFSPLNSWCISIIFRTILSWVSQFLIHVQSGLHVGAINATRGLGANAWLKCAPLFSGGVAPPNIACMHQWRCVGIPRAFVPPPPPLRQCLRYHPLKVVRVLSYRSAPLLRVFQSV